MESKGLFKSQECRENALQKSSDSIYLKSKSSSDLQMDDKYLITDTDVKEAMKKLTQSIHHSQKSTPNEDFPCSSSGHRFYNWNTTHFYPDVHKLDIGILFRHNEKLGHHGLRRRDLSDDEPECLDSFDNDREKPRTKFVKNKSASKNMVLSHSSNGNLTHGHMKGDGLGVKIDIDLDSGSDSSDDDRDGQWHKNPMRVRCIRRQDGRPLSAEINYDAASKKLYIHTLSEKLDDAERRSLVGKGRGAKILRRQSAPSSEAHNGFRNNERKTEFDSKNVSQCHVPIVTSFGNLGVVDSHTGIQNSGSREHAERHDRRLNKDFGEDNVANYHLLHQTCSKEDLSSSYPENCEQNIQAHRHLKQFHNPTVLRTSDNRKPLKKTEFNGSSSNHFQPITNSKQIDISKQSEHKNNELSATHSLSQCNLQSSSPLIVNSSSFENIYDSFGNVPKRVPNENFEFRDRDFGQDAVEPSMKHLANERFSKDKSCFCPSAIHSQSEVQKQINCKKVIEDKVEFGCSQKPGYCQTEKTVLIPEAKPFLNDNQYKSIPKKSHIDAKSIVKEEKQKFEDYKLEYRRQLSAGPDPVSEPGSQIMNVQSQSQSTEESSKRSSRSIHPNDFVYMPIKADGNSDKLLCPEAQKKTANALKASHCLNADNISGNLHLHNLEHQHGNQKRLGRDSVNQQKPKAVLLSNEIHLNCHDTMVLDIADGNLSRNIVNQEPKAASAFHRIIKPANSSVEPALLERNTIQSRRPDLIPSPCISIDSNISSDTFCTGSKEARGKEWERPITACSASSLHTSSGPKPQAANLNLRLSSGHAGVLQKPPKPRKDESSGSAEPEQWKYNTSYEPTMSPMGQNVQSAFSNVNFVRDRNSSEVLHAKQTESRNSAFTDVPLSNLPFPSSDSMNIFRSLPEQYRLSIQEPSSPVTDSLISRNGAMPLYHKECDEMKQKILHDPMCTKELSCPGTISKKSSVPMCPPAAIETYLTEDVLNRSEKCNNNQRYDKAMVFSLTGFHNSRNKDNHGSEKEMCSHEKGHLGRENPKSCVSLQPSFQALNSDLLRQTLWTDVEKRRPICWTDADKRRPIVDWPDLDNISPDLDFRSSIAQDSVLGSFDYIEPQHRTMNLDLKINKLDEKQKDHRYLHNSSFERQSLGDLSSSAEYMSLSEHADFVSQINYVGVKASEVSTIEDRKSERNLSSDPQVFYAVKFIPKEEPASSNRPSTRYNIMESSPPMFFPQHNVSPYKFLDSQCDGQEHLKQACSDAKRLVSPSVLENDLVLRNIKSTRSFSQPDASKPNGSVVDFSNNMKGAPDGKYLYGGQQKLDVHKNKEQPERNNFQNQSQASAEYEKHVNRIQESYKAKKDQSVEPRVSEQLFNTSMNSTPKSLSFEGKLPNTTPLPKQKSALELHLSSSFAKHSASPATTPGEECRKMAEPMNIEVDIRPPITEDSPQVYGMSVRWTGSQENMDTQSEEELPQISVAAIKAKLFGHNEGNIQCLSGHQLAFQSSQNANPNSIQSWAGTPYSTGKSQSNKILYDHSNVQNSKSNKNIDDEKLYDYVSYKDGIEKKRSKINDHLTDFERVYEKLDFYDCDDNDNPILHSSIRGAEFSADSSNVKHLSITNLKLLTENQENRVPNSNLEYTKEWIRTGKGHFHSQECCKTSDATDQARVCSSITGEHENMSNRNSVSTLNFPRKRIDDMAFRRYGSSNVKCVRSDPDLPVNFVQDCGSASNVPDIEPTQSLTNLRHIDRLGFKEDFSNKPSSETKKKVEFHTQLSTYQSPLCRNQLKKTIITKSPVYSMNQNRKQMQHDESQLHRSSSFESSSKKINPDMQSHSSRVGKLVERFDISQSAPDLTDSGGFVESYEEPDFVKVTPMTKKQKTLKDVKLKNERRPRAHLLKMNADSGYEKGENDNQNHAGKETQSFAADINLKSASNGRRIATDSDSRETSTLNEYRLFTDKRNDCEDVEPPGKYQQILTKSVTPDEKSKSLKKLREDFFTAKEETNRSLFRSDQLRFEKRTFLNNLPQNRTTVTLPSGNTNVKNESIANHENFLLPSADSSVSPRKIRTMVSMDVTPNSSVTNRGSLKCDYGEETKLETGHSADVDLLKGPEIQKATLNLSLSIPAVTSRAGHLYLPSIDPTFRDNLIVHFDEPRPQFEFLNQTDDKAAKISCKEICTEKEKLESFEGQSEFPSRNVGKNKAEKSIGNYSTTRETDIKKIQFEPHEFEASRTFGRVIHQPITKSVNYETEELQTEREIISKFDAQITKQRTRTTEKQVYGIEKHSEIHSSNRNVSKVDATDSSNARCSLAPPALLDRLEFSDGEMTDATDVTLDALVHFNQPRPSSSETLDFSDIDVSSSSFSSKITENAKGGIVTQAEVMQSSYQRSKMSGGKSVDRTGDQSTWDNSSIEIISASNQLSNAKDEMKRYKKVQEQKVQTERRRSIKELVNSFEVMTSPFMRSHQKSMEVRSEDFEKA